MTTPSIRRENDFDIGSTYPITVSSTSESSTVNSSTCTCPTENNNYPSTGGHELLVDRSRQDYTKQGTCSSIILCHTFSPNLKHTLK